MGADWKERLKELKKDLFPKNNEPKKSAQITRLDLSPQTRKKSTEEIIKEIFPERKPIIEASKEVPPVINEVEPISASTVFSKIPLPKKPILTRERITAGLDWGTSFTKVCLRKTLGGEDIPIYPIKFQDGHLSGRASYLCPSLVAVENGKVYFGDMAIEQTPNRVRYQHLKVCLACKSENFSSSCVASEICPVEDDSLMSDLITLYFAWIMNTIRRNIPPELQEPQPSFFYNIGLPIKYLDLGTNAELLKRYRKITFDAWRLSEGVSQGIDLNNARNWLSQIKGDSPPSVENSPVLLAPESSAAIVSYVNSVDSEPGLYCIVDIGAWTTDISFFRLSDNTLESTGVQSLYFYATEVWRNATKTIDDRLLKSLMELTGIKSVKEFTEKDLYSKLGQLREKRKLTAMEVGFSTETNNRDKIKIPAYAVDFARGVTSEIFGRNFSTTLKKASEKETVQERWKNFTIFLTGGGSLETCFRDKIGEKHTSLAPEIRSNMLNFPMLQTKSTDQEPERLAVAAGLSHPLPMWPDQVRPSKVSDWIRPPVIPMPELDDEPG